MHRIYLAISLLVLCFAPLRAEILADGIKLSSKINLFATQASTPRYFLQDYKKAAADITFDFSYQITEDFSFNFLPYAQISYDINRTDRTNTIARIWQVYLYYKLADFDFTLGRFAFMDRALAPFIYYGDDLPKDLALPTSLDGIKHSYKSKYLDYALFAAEESQIAEYNKAKTAGAKLTVKPVSWLEVWGFSLYQYKNYEQENKNITSNLILYGGGLGLLLSEEAGLNLYYAHNGGDMEIKRNLLKVNNPYRGYTYGGEIYFKTNYKIGDLNSKMGFHILSDKDFYTLPNKLNTGIIYGGMTYGDAFLASPKIIYTDFVFSPAKFPFFYGKAGVFVYASKKENITNHTYYAQEINLTLGLKFDNYGFKVSGGLFDGEAIFLGTNSTEIQRIKKLQANFFYNFGL